jgi:CheY-like chemotaxis protein
MRGAPLPSGEPTLACLASKLQRRLTRSIARGVPQVNRESGLAAAVSLCWSAASRLPPVARILVVDDERLVATALRRLLRGQQVTVTQSGAEAIELFCQGEFDLMFCDLMMPGISGLDVWLTVRERSPGLEKRIVFMSGGTFTARAETFLTDHPCTCVEKPFDVSEVWSQIQRLCTLPR